MLAGVVSMDLTSVLVGGCLLLIGWLAMAKPRGLPPGPSWRIPFLGHMHLLSGDVLSNLKNLRQKYGDIFHLYIGPQTVVFLNGYDVIKEALVKNGDDFSDRHFPEGFEEFGMGKGIITSSGETWREHRKFALGALREFGVGKNSLQGRICEEVTQFLDCLEERKGEAFNIREDLQPAVSNVICRIVYGKRFDYDDVTFQGYMRVLNEGLRSTRVLSIIGGKVAKHVPGDIFGFHKAVSRMEVIREGMGVAPLREHLKTFDANHVRDFIDAYIKAMKEKADEGLETNLSEDQLWRVILDLFIAGSETTGTTILWAVLYLMNHPDIQQRLHRELQDKIGSGRRPTMEDRSELPFLNAFTLEVQRHADIAPLSVSHGLKHDVTFRGYRLPKGCLVFPVLDSVLRDPKVWGDPDVFRPDRFLKDGKVVKPEEFIPFGIGRRVCLGESLAKMELFLFLSAMIQRFRFEPQENEAPPELKGVVGITHSPNAFRMRAIRRQ